jgi:acyl-CoA synthetase (AMP-forming)/AMP-acid ligase II
LDVWRTQTRFVSLLIYYILLIHYPEITRLAAFLGDHKIGYKDFVAVYTTNSPEMVITILALSQLGAVAALINTNLRGKLLLFLLHGNSINGVLDDTLKHCLEISTARTIISTPDLAEHINGSFQHFSLNLSSFRNLQNEKPNNCTTIFINLKDLPSPAVASPPAKATPRDIAVLIFTSGKSDGFWGKASYSMLL